MNFLFTINNKYIQPIKLLIYSIEKNNPNSNKSYYFIYNNISDDNQVIISNYVERFNSKVYFIPFKWDKTDLLHENGTWSREIYYRLFAPYLLPNLDTILYLDGDTIVNDNLSNLFTESIRDNALAAVLNDEETIHLNRLKNGLKHYYNSGVLLMNLSMIRKHFDFETMKQMVLTLTKEYTFPDQDFINVVFKDKIFELPQKYNYMINLTERKASYHRLKNYSICHFVLQKPWDYEFPYLTDRKYLLYLYKSGCFGLATKLWFHHRKYRLSLKIKKR